MATHLHSKNHWSTYNLWSEEVGSWIFAKPWKRNKKIIRLTWEIGKDFGLYSSSFFSMKNHFKILYWLSHLYNSFNTLTFTIFTVYAHFDYKLIVNALNKNFNVLLSLNLTTLSISIRHISLILTRCLLKWAEIGVLHVIASTNWLIIHIISIVIAILRTYALPTFSIIWWNTSTIKMACLILAGVCLTLRINIAPLSPNTECQ